MTPAAETLRALLEAHDLDAFLEALEVYRQQHTTEPEVTALTQRVFPPLLRQAFRDERLQSASLVRLYRLVRTGRLVMVEDDLLAGINLRINDALRHVEPGSARGRPSTRSTSARTPAVASRSGSSCTRCGSSSHCCRPIPTSP